MIEWISPFFCMVRKSWLHVGRKVKCKVRNKLCTKKRFPSRSSFCSKTRSSPIIFYVIAPPTLSFNDLFVHVSGSQKIDKHWIIRVFVLDTTYIQAVYVRRLQFEMRWNILFCTRETREREVADHNNSRSCDRQLSMGFARVTCTPPIRCIPADWQVIGG